MKSIKKKINIINGKYNLKLVVNGSSKEELEETLEDILCDLGEQYAN